MTNNAGNSIDSDIRIEFCAPVLKVEPEQIYTYPNGDELPAIWVTQDVDESITFAQGRRHVLLYPQTEDPDEDGRDALYWGGCYYDEGMGYTDSEDREKRIDCFRAAEIFYRHSAGRGNAVAYLCLGYVYSYDRAEGQYWRTAASVSAGGSCTLSFPREERAFECFKLAAEAGLPEACYKFGDAYRNGVGCTSDASETFRWYVRASELAVRESPVILGSIALRLASCYEEGFGCDQDFERALKWYKNAVSGLQTAVDAGEWYYEKALAKAKAGLVCCSQEVNGTAED